MMQQSTLKSESGCNKNVSGRRINSAADDIILKKGNLKRNREWERRTVNCHDNKFALSSWGARRSASCVDDRWQIDGAFHIKDIFQHATKVREFLADVLEREAFICYLKWNTRVTRLINFRNIATSPTTCAFSANWLNVQPPICCAQMTLSSVVVKKVIKRFTS